MADISQGRVSQTTFIALIWAWTAIAFPFLIFRLFVRWKVFRTLFIDDALVVLAYSILLSYAAFMQTRAEDIYYVIRVAIGAEQTDGSFNSHFYRFNKSQLATNFLYPFCLWSVKLAFLLFFRRLGKRVRYQEIFWWCILAFNTSTLAVWLGVSNWHCLVNSLEVVLATCDSQQTLYWDRLSLRVQTAMDVISDFSIILIPINLLWKVQIPTNKKFALGGIFSLSIFIMVASITRGAILTSVTEFDLTWFYPWSGIEMAVAIIVVCVGSFRALFTPQTLSQRLPQYREGGSLSDRQQLKQSGFRALEHSSDDLAASRRSRDDSNSFPYSIVTADRAVLTDRGIGNKSYAMRKISPNESPVLENDRIYVRDEFLVHPNTYLERRGD